MLINNSPRKRPATEPCLDIDGRQQYWPAIEVLALHSPLLPYVRPMPWCALDFLQDDERDFRIFLQCTSRPVVHVVLLDPPRETLVRMRPRQTLLPCEIFGLCLSE